MSFRFKELKVSHNNMETVIFAVYPQYANLDKFLDLTATQFRGSHYLWLVIEGSVVLGYSMKYLLQPCNYYDSSLQKACASFCLFGPSGRGHLVMLMQKACMTLVTQKNDISPEV